MTARYAVYFAPAPDTALAAFGRTWLGRDAETGAAVEQPALPGIDATTLHAQTASPRFYGFHGTLKPPFALAPGCEAAGLETTLAAFAATQAPFELAGLRLARLENFLALVPTQPSPLLDRLAADCVRDFDAFRAPPLDADLAKRRANGLTPVQEANLQRWGYPFVFEEFRFHLTLTGPIAEDSLRDHFAAALAPLAAPFAAAPVRVDALCLFRQPDRATPFRLVRRVPFGG